MAENIYSSKINPLPKKIVEAEQEAINGYANAVGKCLKENGIDLSPDQTERLKERLRQAHANRKPWER